MIPTLFIRIGMKIVGMCVVIDGVLTDRLFNHGCPWEITDVKFSHASDDGRRFYRLTARSAEGYEQSIGTFAHNEGVIPL